MQVQEVLNGALGCNDNEHLFFSSLVVLAVLVLVQKSAQRFCCSGTLVEVTKECV